MERIENFKDGYTPLDEKHLNPIINKLNEIGEVVDKANNGEFNGANAFSWTTANALGAINTTVANVAVDQIGASVPSVGNIVQSTHANSMWGIITAVANSNTVTVRVAGTNRGGQGAQGVPGLNGTINGEAVIRKSTTFIIGFSNDCDLQLNPTANTHHTSIANAIRERPNGGEYILREGTYRFGGVVTIDTPNVTIRGMGSSTRIIGTTGTIRARFDIARSNVLIENLMIDSTNVTSTVLESGSIRIQAVGTHAIHDFSNIEIRNCEFIGADRTIAINLRDFSVSNIRIQNNVFLGRRNSIIQVANFIGIAPEVVASTVIFANNTVVMDTSLTGLSTTSRLNGFFVTNNTFTEPSGRPYARFAFNARNAVVTSNMGNGVPIPDSLLVSSAATRVIGFTKDCDVILDPNATNHQSAINSETLAVHNRGGGIVILREGVYTTNALINLRENVVLQGVGRATEIRPLDPNDRAHAQFSFVGSNSEVRDLYINIGDGVRSGITLHDGIIRTTNFANTKMRNLKIRNIALVGRFADRGICLGGNINGYTQNVLIENCEIDISGAAVAFFNNGALTGTCGGFNMSNCVLNSSSLPNNTAILTNTAAAAWAHDRQTVSGCSFWYPSANTTISTVRRWVGLNKINGVPVSEL